MVGEIISCCDKVRNTTLYFCKGNINKEEFTSKLIYNDKYSNQNFKQVIFGYAKFHLDTRGFHIRISDRPISGYFPITYIEVETKPAVRKYSLVEIFNFEANTKFLDQNGDIYIINENEKGKYLNTVITEQIIHMKFVKMN